VYAAELARRYPSIKTVSVHPGVVNTGLVSTLPLGHRMLIHGLNKLNVLDILPEDKGKLNSLVSHTEPPSGPAFYLLSSSLW
jgi:hypothetical protein